MRKGVVVAATLIFGILAGCTGGPTLTTTPVADSCLPGWEHSICTRSAASRGWQELGNLTFSDMVQARDPHSIQLNGDWVLWQQGGGAFQSGGECSQVIAYNLANRTLHSVFAASDDSYCKPVSPHEGKVVRHRFDGVIDVIAVTSPGGYERSSWDLWVWSAATLQARPLYDIANLTDASPAGNGLIVGLADAGDGYNRTVTAVDATTGQMYRAPGAVQWHRELGQFTSIIDGSGGTAYLVFTGRNITQEVWSWDIRTGSLRDLGSVAGYLVPFTDRWRDSNERPVYEPLPKSRLLISALDAGNLILEPDRIVRLPPGVAGLLGNPPASRNSGFLSADDTYAYSRAYVNRTVACVDFYGCQRTVLRSTSLVDGAVAVIDWPADVPDRTVIHPQKNGGSFEEFIFAPRLTRIFGYSRDIDAEAWGIQLDVPSRMSYPCICVASPPKP